MEVKETSKSAYVDLFAKPYDQLSNMQKKILDFMDLNKEYTRKQLSVITGMETSTIAGRVNELVVNGDIEIIGKRICPISNKTVESLRRIVWPMNKEPL